MHTIIQIMINSLCLNRYGLLACLHLRTLEVDGKDVLFSACLKTVIMERVLELSATTRQNQKAPTYGPTTFTNHACTHSQI